MYNKLKFFQRPEKIILQLHLQLQKLLNFLVSINFYKNNFFCLHNDLILYCDKKFLNMFFKFIMKMLK